MVPLIHPIFSQYVQHSYQGSWRCWSMASATTIWRHLVAFSWDRSLGKEEKFEDDFTSGSGDDKFFTVDPERPLSLPFQRYSLDHHRQSAGGEGFGKIIFRRKVPRDEQSHSQEIKRSVSSMPSSLPAVLEMCRHKFVHLFFFIGGHFLFSDCGCTSPSPMSTSARPKRRVWKSCSKNTGTPKMSIDILD